MTQPTTTRRDLLRLGTSAAAYAAGAAIVTGGVALAGEAKGATLASPALLALIADVERAKAEAIAFGANVYNPARDRMLAAEDEAPHIEVPGFRSGTWSTDDGRRVANARMWTSKPREMSTDAQREEFAAMQRLVAAHDERQAHVDRAGDRASFNRIHDQDEENGARWADATDAVANFPAATAIDLRFKLAFMVENEMGDGMDWLPELLADAERIAGVVA